jgi:hypothetical protein
MRLVVAVWNMFINFRVSHHLNFIIMKTLVYLIPLSLLITFSARAQEKKEMS